jgi:hypothetical protein
MATPRSRPFLFFPLVGMPLQGRGGTRGRAITNNKADEQQAPASTGLMDQVASRLPSHPSFLEKSQETWMAAARSARSPAHIKKSWAASLSVRPLERPVNGVDLFS